MTEILITAGGTSEPIDGVRKISNSSTGSLGVCIYEALADRLEREGETGYLVHYVVSTTAVRPEPRKSLPVEFHPVSSVESVRAVLEALLTKRKIGCVIHSMAVSDFTTGYLAPRRALADELAAAAEKAALAGPGSPELKSLRETMAAILEHPDAALSCDKKVSSGEELILSLVKTPKLIGLIKKWDPSVLLVGFKLLRSVSEEELTKAACGLAEQNRCDLVLANDLSRITSEGHFGMLICGGAVVGRYETKREIAAGIAGKVLSALEKGRETG